MEKMEVMYFIYFSVALLMANGIIQYRMTKNLELKIKNKWRDQGNLLEPNKDEDEGP